GCRGWYGEYGWQPLTEIVQGLLGCSELSLFSRMKGETPVNSTMSIGQARKMVEQLKIEASLCRIKVSKAAADLMTYCDAHACEDPLITPVPTSENPFREKKFFCALL
ncbi:Guanine nucleotide-binding protein G(I)/G(S)/G(O) subunit gamma-3, partial [Galemys pyrenaicus]